MFPDNAADIVTIHDQASVDPFAEMTDRELLEYNARTLSQILAIADQVKEQVAPLVDSVSSNPMLKMLFPKR